MNLKEFRDQYPGFKPNWIVGNKETYLELTGYPFTTEDGEVIVYARLPQNPMTLQVYNVKELVAIRCVCDRDDTEFDPVLGVDGSITCPVCNRGYFPNSTSTEWHSDRLLKLKRR